MNSNVLIQHIRNYKHEPIATLVAVGNKGTVRYGWSCVYSDQKGNPKDRIVKKIGIRLALQKISSKGIRPVPKKIYHEMLNFIAKTKTSKRFNGFIFQDGVKMHKLSNNWFLIYLRRIRKYM